MSINNKYNLPNNLYDKLIDANIDEYSIAQIIEEHNQNSSQHIDRLIQATVSMSQVNPALTELREYLIRKEQQMPEQPNNRFNLPNDLYTRLRFAGVTDSEIAEFHPEKVRLNRAIIEAMRYANYELHEVLKDLEIYLLSKEGKIPSNLYIDLQAAGLSVSDIDDMLSCREYIDLFISANPYGPGLVSLLKALSAFIDKAQKLTYHCDTQLTKDSMNSQESVSCVEEFTEVVRKMQEANISYEVLHDWYANKLSISKPFDTLKFLSSFSVVSRYKVVSCVTHCFKYLTKQEMLQIIDYAYDIKPTACNNQFNLPNNLYDKLTNANMSEATISRIMEEPVRNGAHSIDTLITATIALPEANAALKEFREYLTSQTTTAETNTTNNRFNIPNRLYDKLASAQIGEDIISLIIKDHTQNSTERIDMLLASSISLPEVNAALKEFKEYLTNQTTIIEPVNEAPRALTKDEALLKCLSSFIDTGIGYETIEALAHTDLNLKDANLSSGSPIMRCDWRYAKEANLPKLYASLLTTNNIHNEIIKQMCQTGNLPFNLTIYDIVHDITKLKVIGGIIHYDKTHSDNYIKLSKVIHLYGIDAIMLHLGANNKHNLPNSLYAKLTDAGVDDALLAHLLRFHSNGSMEAIDEVIQNSGHIPKMNQALIELREYLSGKQQTANEPKLSTRFATTPS